MKSERASLEISTSFLVKLIIAIVVFGMGLLIVRNIFSATESGELTEGMTLEMENQIRGLMNSGDTVVMFPEQIETTPNKVAVFGLGVLNIMDQALFNMELSCGSFTPQNSDDSVACQEDYEDWFLPDYPSLNLDTDEEGTISIPVLPSTAEKGTYVFNVRVFYDSVDVVEGEYGIVRFWLTVK